MPWVRIDDHFNEHPKLAAAGPLAWALWLVGLAYCNRNLTDGFIPWSTAGSLVSWDFMADRPTRLYVGDRDSVYEENAVTSDYVIGLLTSAGIWDVVAGGYRVHDYEDYQPTKAQVEADRAAKVAAGRAGGVATAAARGAAPATAHGVAKVRPVPKPNPVPVSNGSQNRAIAREETSETTDEEADLFAFLAQKGAYIRPDSGFGIRLLGLIDRRGVEVVLEAARTMVSDGVVVLSDRQWVFGLEKLLEAIPSPPMDELLPDTSVTDEKSRRIFDRMTKRRLEWLQQTGQWPEEWGDRPSLPA